MMSRYCFAFILLISSSFLMRPAFAVDQIYTGFFSSEAVSGYDTVAYFKEGKPVKGTDDFKTEWNGATWKFSSAENPGPLSSGP